MHKEAQEEAKKRQAEVQAEARKLTPPSESNTSTVLNGIGNGTMIGTLPFFGLQLYHDIAHYGTGKQIPRNAHIACAFSLVAGTVVGAFMGQREARRLAEYRKALSEEIIDLRMNAEDTNDRLQKWQKKLETHAAQPEHSITDTKGR